jgi:hypothetical protein
MIRRVSQTAFLVFALTSMVHARRVATKDLLHSADSVTENVLAQIGQEGQHANGCKELNVGGYVDGVTLDEDKKPRKLSVKLAKISTTKLTIDREIIATAKLQNVGSKSVQIPWSTDPRTITDGQPTDDLSWEVAEFRMSMQDKRNPQYYDELVMTSQPLYASKFVSGSYLTLRPGEWITAQISFKVAVGEPEFEELNIGTVTLAMEWFQEVRTRVVKNCAVTLGYFRYDAPFYSVNRRAVAKVQIESPSRPVKSPQ